MVNARPTIRGNGCERSDNQISPVPARRNHISSTVACLTARRPVPQATENVSTRRSRHWATAAPRNHPVRVVGISGQFDDLGHEQPLQTIDQSASGWEAASRPPLCTSDAVPDRPAHVYSNCGHVPADEQALARRGCDRAGRGQQAVRGQPESKVHVYLMRCCLIAYHR
jgi:hypothetical protein